MPLQSTPKACPVCNRASGFKFIRDFISATNKFSLYQCHECQVQFWLPQIIASREWYERTNPYGVRSLGKTKIRRGYHKKFLKRCKDFSKNTNVLDLGCGTGEFIAELKKRGCQVWGLDLDREAIKIAKENFGLENVYSESFEEFFKRNNLPLFDVVTFFEVIEHLNNPLEFIKNVKKILKPGGKIILSAPYRERILPNLNKWDFPPHHLTRWNERAILEVSKICGFQLSHVDYVEELKIISESLIGWSKTGLVGKSLNAGQSSRDLRVLAKMIYFMGCCKDFILGKMPASFLWVFSKIFNKKNGIMLIELKEISGKAVKSKKVIFFIPILTLGGGERVVSELSLNLPDSIEKVVVLLENQISYPYNGRLICLNIPISNPLFLRIWYFFVAIKKFRKVVRQEKPDYVISFGTPANIINVLSNKKTIIRVDNFLSSSSNWIYKTLIKIFFNKASRIICVSKASAQDLVDNFKIDSKKIKVIYNPINIEDIKTLSSELLDPPHKKIFESPVVISMGRLSKQKSQWYLIRAFKEVKKVVKDAKLVILGTGELQLELENMAKELGIEDDVHFLGWQKNPFKFLAKSKVFVLSSLWEGLPYVVLEAMACGLPIISADCKSGPREILAPKTNINQEAKEIEYGECGILTPAFDGKRYKANALLTKSEDYLGKAIVELLSNKEIANNLVEKSKNRAENFSVKNIIKEWEFLNYENNRKI